MKRTNKRQKINKHQSEIKVDFSAKNISPFGGLGLFRKLVQKLGVEKALESINPSQANENGKGRYTVGEKIMSLIYGLVLDLVHLLGAGHWDCQTASFPQPIMHTLGLGCG